MQRRAEGEPFAYLVGEREFYGRSFRVDPRVLIPRPETELLVESVLELEPESGALVVDVGTGSGCVALTLALERPDLRVVGTDLSLAALAVARENRARFGLERRVPLVCCDLFGALAAAAISMVASNPPYVGRDEPLPPEVIEYEPAMALFPMTPENDATALYAALLGERSDLREGARACLEIGFGQSDEIARLAGPQWRVTRIRPDLAGIPRVVELLVATD